MRRGDRAWTKNILDAAITWAAKNPLSRATESAGAQRSDGAHHAAWAKSRAWPGRTGFTDRAIYLALCHRATLDGTEWFRASRRELSELSRKGKVAVTKSLKRMTEHGLVEEWPQDRRQSATLWRLRPVPPIDSTPLRDSQTVPPHGSAAWERPRRRCGRGCWGCQGKPRGSCRPARGVAAAPCTMR